MEDLLRENIGFYPDLDGNVQAIIYPGRIPMIISPLPLIKGFKTKQYPVSSFVFSYEKTKKIIEEKKLVIKKEDEYGIECAPIKPLNYIYFPLNKGGKNIPLLKDNSSERKTYVLGNKIAQILCERAKYLYSLDPVNFGKNSFIISDSPINLSDKLDVLTSDRKLAVPSEKIRDRLIRFVQQGIANDKPGILKMSEDEHIAESVYYSSVTDFKADNNTLVFGDLNNVKNWVAVREITKNWNKILDYVDEDTSNPYFFSYPGFFSGKDVLINNVASGTLADALYVCKIWREKKHNLGYGAKAPEDFETSKQNYRVTREDGHVVEHVLSSSSRILYEVFLYSNGSYSAVLFS